MRQSGLIVCLLFSLWAGAQSKPPNFIIILADDLGYADLSVQESSQIKTPNIDALAETGVKFTQGYVSSAVCAPSRAGLLTGVNQVEFGFDNNIGESQVGFDPKFLGLPIDQKTIATRLQELGYVTGLIGKWHLGDQPQFHPTNRGFDEFWGYLGGAHDYFSSESNRVGRYAQIICNYKEPQQINYITDDKGDESVGFIKRHKDDPFFLFASFNAPHSPMQATSQDLKLYSHIEDANRRTYAAMVHRLDVNVGKIMRALEDEGLSENTVVVFLSDNGGPCNQNYSLNAPLRGQKGILLEGGIRVPFFMSWPGRIKAGLVYNEFITSLDLAPTFLALAGGDFSENDFTGVDIFPFISGSGQNGVPHETLQWRFTISSAIRSGDWKLISLPDRLPMLYHLPSDISEQHNVALDSIHITKKMLGELGNWKVHLPHPLFLEGMKWKQKQLNLYDKKY